MAEGRCAPSGYRRHRRAPPTNPICTITLYIFHNERLREWHHYWRRAACVNRYREPLPAQRPAAIEPSSHRERHAFAQSNRADSTLGVVAALRFAPADSNRNAGQRTVRYAVIGGVLGAVIGAVVGNQYAQAHKPPCVRVPAGPPCRYLDPDNSSSYRGLGIGLGAGLGLVIGVLRAR